MTTADLRSDTFRMPALGADMTEGRVVEWYVASGAHADRGQLVAVIETDKSDIEIEVFDPCVFDEFLVGLGEPVAVGEPIARITLDEPRAEAPTPAPAAPDPAAPTVAPDRAAAPSVIDETPERRRMTPRARRLARARGLEPSGLPAGGTVTGDTIMRLADERGTKRPTSPKAPNVRRAVARLMERSWADIPHYHVASTLDLTEANGRLERYNADRAVDDRVVMAAVLYAAVARAAADTPRLNGWWRDGEFEPSDSVDLGVIVSLRTGGIVVPTIRNADRLDAAQMMTNVRELVERSRRGRLRERDLHPASISTTNMGELGADRVFGVIHPPQVALIGLGAPHLGPAVVDGAIAPRLLIEATVAGDHRAHDGLVAARLLRHLSRHLEELP